MTARYRMNRRALLALVGGAVSWPMGLRAEQSNPVVGFLGLPSAATWHPLVSAFRDGLGSAGYIDGKNVAIEFRWAEGQPARLPALAADLVRRGVAIIVAAGGPGPVRAAMAETRIIPIVFTLASDPVEQGLVASLGRPSGNVTGVSMIAHHLIPKKLELLHTLVPPAGKIGILANPANPSWRLYLKDAQTTASALGRQIEVLNARNEREFDDIFARIIQMRIAGVLVAADPIFDRNARLIALAARYAIPTMYTWREDVEAGGLFSYGISIKDAYHQAGIYAGRILKGERPRDLPILQPTKVELVVNLRTARALHIVIPDSIMVRADEVIE